MDDGENQGRGEWLIIGAAILWGTTGTAQGLAPEGASPTVIGALRLAIGGAALLAIAVSRRTLLTGRRWPPVTTALSIFLVASYQLAFFSAVAATGVAVGTMVAIGSAPIAAGILGYLVRREHLGGRWIGATLLAIIGCAMLIFAEGDVRMRPGGILLALAAGASYAAYTVTIKGLLTDFAPDAVMAVVFSGAGLLLLPCILVGDVSWLAKPAGMAVALHLGLFTAALSYFLFARGLRTVKVGVVGTLTLAEPLTASLLGVAVLGEHLSGMEQIGIVVLFCGIAVMAVNPQMIAASCRRIADRLF